MADQEAYRRYTAEAERLMATAGEYSAHDGEKVALVQRATVWAALALAAAQDRVQPANRPLNDGVPISSPPGPVNRWLPNKIKDGDGDTWTLNKDTGTYETHGVGEPHTLEAIARDYRGYTEVP